MSESQKKILEMLHEKKITVDEAERLLSVTSSKEGKEEMSREESGITRKPKYLRVLVEPTGVPDAGHGTERVNIRVPFNLIRAGMKLTSLIPQDAAEKVNDAMEEKGIKFDLKNLKDLDMEELIAALNELEINVESDNEKVHVFVE